MAARILAVVAAVLLVAGQVAAAAAPPPGAREVTSAAPIEKGLLAKLEKGVQRFVVEFSAKTDVRAAAKGKKGHAQRGAAVFKALSATANSSQAAALKIARAVNGSNAKSYWLTNTMYVTGDAKLARKLASVKGVSGIHATKVYPLVKPVATKAAILAAAGDPEWGVDLIGADDVWAEGVLGSGIVVGSVDTGVDFTHPALVNNYRGNNHDGTFTHDYNWWDPSNSCPGEPCDNVGHGTHTMGTMVGGDGPGPFTPDTGVAPGAEWMTAKGCEDFGCTSESLLSSGQFILAPTDMSGDPLSADPSKAPDVVNNSWGSPDPNDTFYLATVQAWRAAGIIPVFSAGNEGPFCGSNGTPGNFTQVISLGATDSKDNIADFSSRGPSPTGKVSPNLAAPGVDVISSVPGGGYEAFSGTSMAAPHATGTIALMLSAKASLIGDFDGVLNALDVTAIDHPDDQCGSPDPSDNDPNYVYGEGRIDAKAAVDLVKTGGTLSGTVTDSATSDPVPGARVTANNGERDFSTIANGSGDYSIFLASGTYAVTGTAFGYAPSFNVGVQVDTDQTTDLDIALDPLPKFHVTGTVTGSEDGSAIEGASVLALGTPVPAATTDASGAYDLVLPIGTYTLRASAGGCTEIASAEVTLAAADVVQDFSLFRKLDDFGHGCRAITFDWVDAGSQSALYGDEFAGRLRLPFDFEFYGTTYHQVFLSDNGYLNFLGPDQYNGFPIAIPNAGPPNAAIYAFWQDLAIDESSSIDYDTIGVSPDRAFVIEYSNMQVFGSSAHISFEVKLWENGSIDMLYAANPANPGDGRNAGIGIENATGTDALQFSFLQDVVVPNTAYRYEHVPTGLIHGVVTDANDGLPIAGAKVTATPGGRSATTAGDGTYSLRLRPGSYQLAASADNYVTGTSALIVSDGSDDVRDFALTAPIASVDPPSIDATVDFGDVTSAHLTISNNGSAPYHWVAKEQSLGACTPLKTFSPKLVTWVPGWHKPKVSGPRPGSSRSAASLPPPGLEPIIDDPVGDSNGSIDVTQIRAGIDGCNLAMSIDFAQGTPMSDAVGEIYVDVDQNPDTGIPAPFLAGLPTQDVGAEYLIGLFAVHDPDPFVFVLDLNTFDIVGIGPASVDGNTINFEVGLDAMGGDDGNMDVDFALGDFFQPLDWAPDVGHGTVSPFSDIPWLSESPDSGTTGVGSPTDVTVNLGAPTLAPGEYHAVIAVLGDDPKHTKIPVDVNLTVNMPATFGGLNGTVTDAHTGEPLAGVSVVINTTFNGNPLDLTATTAGDGTYAVLGPEGTWPAAYSLASYVTDDRNVTITAGTTNTEDVALHRDQPHGAIDTDSLQFVLTEGRTGDATVHLSNPDGHEPLTFTVGEVNLDSAQAVAAATSGHSLPAGAAPNARTTKGIFGHSNLAIPPAILADGDVLQSWNAGMTSPWGVGTTGDVWLSDFNDLINAQFTTGGTRLNTFPVPTTGVWAADMAYDAGRNLIWQVNVGGDNGLYGFNPADGSLAQVITGDPWTGISQRGVAYDGAADVFYVGGWNEGIVYRVAGPSWPNPGETLSQCSPADGGISGLAWNSSFNLLWEATNSDTDTIYLLDPGTCDTLRALPHPDGGGFGGAGLETDVVGNLWTVGQNTGNAYLIESGLPNFSDVPWLAVDPTAGTIDPNGSQALTVSVDTTGVASGVYHAIVVIQTNDPDHANIQVPVTLVVPAYQQGVDVGAGSFTDPANGDFYAVDRAYSVGGFGYVGPSSVRATKHDIAGTDRDPLYADLRTGMSGYSFTVPDGTYAVTLSFAELQLDKAGSRVFNVAMEGTSVVDNFDVWAAAGGRYVAVDRTFVVEVTDGILDISFTAQRGDSPIVNAIIVTEMPPGSPGF